MKLYQLAILSALTLVPSFGAAAQGEKWLSYEPAVVKVEGRLTEVWKFGPPNFGEHPKTDRKVRVPILVLSEPINVQGNPKEFPFNVQVKGIRRIQLITFDLKGPYRQFIGKSVVVEGTLFHGHTGGHYTDIVMDVQSIREKGKRR